MLLKPAGHRMATMQAENKHQSPMSMKHQREPQEPARISRFTCHLLPRPSDQQRPYYSLFGMIPLRMRVRVSSLLILPSGEFHIGDLPRPSNTVHTASITPCSKWNLGNQMLIPRWLSKATPSPFTRPCRVGNSATSPPLALSPTVQLFN